MLFCICYFIKEKRVGYGGVNVKWEESPVLFIFFPCFVYCFFCLDVARYEYHLSFLSD